MQCWISGLFQLSITSDCVLGLTLAAEHDLRTELLQALDPQIADEVSLLTFENTRQHEGRVRRAIIFIKAGTLVAIEIAAPRTFEREADAIIEDYAAAVRRQLTAAVIPIQCRTS
jgi:hypothetical protein